MSRRKSDEVEEMLIEARPKMTESQWNVYRKPITLLLSCFISFVALVMLIVLLWHRIEWGFDEWIHEVIFYNFWNGTYIVMSGCVVLILTCALGFWSVWTRSICGIVLTCVFHGTTILLLSVGAIAMISDAFATRENWIATMIIDMINPTNYNNNAVKDEFLGNMYRIIQCCGADGYKDYTDRFDISPPDDCRDKKHAGGIYFEEGCAHKFPYWLKAWAGSVAGVSVVLIIVEIIIMSWSQQLIKIIKRQPKNARLVKSHNGTVPGEKEELLVTSSKSVSGVVKSHSSQQGHANFDPPPFSRTSSNRYTTQNGIQIESSSGISQQQQQQLATFANQSVASPLMIAGIPIMMANSGQFLTSGNMMQNNTMITDQSQMMFQNSIPMNNDQYRNNSNITSSDHGCNHSLPNNGIQHNGSMSSNPTVRANKHPSSNSLHNEVPPPVPKHYYEKIIPRNQHEAQINGKPPRLPEATTPQPNIRSTSLQPNTSAPVHSHQTDIKSASMPQKGSHGLPPNGILTKTAFSQENHLPNLPVDHSTNRFPDDNHTAENSKLEILQLYREVKPGKMPDNPVDKQQQTKHNDQPQKKTKVNWFSPGKKKPLQWGNQVQTKPEVQAKTQTNGFNQASPTIGPSLTNNWSASSSTSGDTQHEEIGPGGQTAPVVPQPGGEQPLFPENRFTKAHFQHGTISYGYENLLPIGQRQRNDPVKGVLNILTSAAETETSTTSTTSTSDDDSDYPPTKRVPPRKRRSKKMFNFALAAKRNQAKAMTESQRVDEEDEEEYLKEQEQKKKQHQRDGHTLFETSL